MTEVITSLTKVLERETQIYTELLTLVKETQQALIDNHMDGLNKCLDAKQELLAKAAKLEEMRQNHLDQLLEIFQLEREKGNLTNLIERVPQEFKGKLTACQQQLQQLVDDINEINRQNEVLIKDSLKFIDYNMSILTGQEETRTYNNKPKDSEQKAKGKSIIFDQKI